jgi:uncharacterized repeat protein (TIGR04138 family)
VSEHNQFDALLRSDPRYPIDAYDFVMAALNFTILRIGERRHISGRELLDGIRDFAHEAFGPMARHVLKAWGISRTDHFGDIVFNLVQHGILAKTDDDTHEDFQGVYSFDEAFGEPDIPKLDEFGHVPRVLRHVDPSEINWAAFLGNVGMN